MSAVYGQYSSVPTTLGVETNFLPTGGVQGGQLYACHTPFLQTGACGSGYQDQVELVNPTGIPLPACGLDPTWHYRSAYDVPVLAPVPQVDVVVTPTEPIPVTPTVPAVVVTPNVTPSPTAATTTTDATTTDAVTVAVTKPGARVVEIERLEAWLDEVRGRLGIRKPAVLAAQVDEVVVAKPWYTKWINWFLIIAAAVLTGSVVFGWTKRKTLKTQYDKIKQQVTEKAQNLRAPQRDAETVLGELNKAAASVLPAHAKSAPKPRKTRHAPTKKRAARVPAGTRWY